MRMKIARIFLLHILVLTFPGVAVAAGFADGLRYVFVAAQDSGRVGVIDSRDDSLAGEMDLGLVPSQLEIAGEPARLAAIDGTTARLSVVPVDGGAARMVTLDFVPTRLLAAGGKIVAAAPEGGWLALVDAARASVVAKGKTAPFRDIQAAEGGERLVLAPRDGERLAIMDTATLSVVAEAAPPRSGLGGYSWLGRAPNGRVVYARAAAMPVLVALDVRAAKVVAEMPTGAARAYSNATGITLLLPDDQTRTVTLVPSSLKGSTVLRGEGTMSGVYSSWFDTVAFIPSSATRSVMVVDQQQGIRGDDIALSGLPGRGVVTPDGRKLYLPVTDGSRVAVIDAERRRLAGWVNLPYRPSVAQMARTFGICH